MLTINQLRIQWPGNLAARTTDIMRLVKCQLAESTFINSRHIERLVIADVAVNHHDSNEKIAHHIVTAINRHIAIGEV